MLNKLFILGCLTLISFSFKAQQDAIYSVFWNNTTVFNPATTGEQSKYFFSNNTRDQWQGTNNNPFNINSTLEWRVDTINSAFGLSYTYEQLGLETSNFVALNYSYHIDLPQNQQIGFGIAPTFATKSFTTQNFVAIDNPASDPSIPSTQQTFQYFDLNVGISYVSEKLKAGVGTTRLLESNGSSPYTNARHTYATISYELEMGNKLKLIPQALIATDYASTAYSFLLLAKYNDIVWLGSSYRKDAFFGFMGGVDFAKKFRIGYNYDFYTDSYIRTNFGATHEFVLAVMLN